MDSESNDSGRDNAMNESAMWSFFIEGLSDIELQTLHGEMQQELLQRAIRSGDHESIIQQAFEIAFDRSGLGVTPMDRRKISCLPWSVSFKKRRKSSVSFCQRRSRMGLAVETTYYRNEKTFSWK